METQLTSKIRKSLIAGIILMILIALSVTMSVNFGTAEISFADVWKIIIGKIFNMPSIIGEIKDSSIAIVWNIRLPRILTGAMVGMGLAVSGTVFQSILMNPLADPYTIGVSTGAAFGASLAIYINIFLENIQVPIILFAFTAALITLSLVIVLAEKGRKFDSSSLIISGIIVSSILSAGISFIKNAAGEEVGAIVFWLMGSLVSRSWTHVHLLTPLIFFGTLICIFFSADLNIVSLGEDTSVSLGIETKKIRFIYLVTASLMTAACVSVSGIIGFVGLIVPHMIRFILTPDNRILIPLSGLLGSIVLMVSDNFSRVLFTNEIPVGIITTLLGGPFFLFIYLRRGKR
jgi:iron complex transport system permease protein